MKKLFSVILFIAAVFLFSGCGGQNDTQNQKSLTKIDQSPAVQADVDKKSAVEGDNITFSASRGLGNSGNIIKYEWFNEDGKLLSTEENFSRVFLNEGIYNTTLKITDEKGVVFSDIVSVKIDRNNASPMQDLENESPVAKASISEYEICVGNGVRFYGNQSFDNDGSIVSYVWKDMDGIVLSTEAVFSRGFPYPATYHKTLTVTDDKGATSSMTVDLVVKVCNGVPAANNNPPLADAGADQSVAVGADVVLNGLNSLDPDGDIITYSWLENGVEFSTAANFTKNDFAAGVHNITLTVTDTDGLSDSDMVIIMVATDLFFDSNITGNVKDLSSANIPLDDVNISLFLDDVFIRNVMTDGNGNYSFENIESNKTYNILATKEGYIDNKYIDIITGADETLNLETIYMQEVQDVTLGTIGGTIVNAINGNGISNLTLNVREGINANTGTIIETVIGDDSGGYVIADLPAGSYTVEAIADGYITGYFSVSSIAEQTTNDQNHALTPILPEGEIRIVLTWGQTPRDLDSHLTGPIEDSSDRFHISYRNQDEGFNSLDRDDTTSFGPETITISLQQSGVYEYFVFDYTNRGSTGSTVFANSDAQVKVYKGPSLIATYNVPNQEGKLWTVFKMEGDQITPINTIGEDSI